MVTDIITALMALQRISKQRGHYVLGEGKN